jgi:hypothetical protein
MNATLTYIVAKGMIYAVKDVAAVGDCALLALRGLNQVDCQQMYAIVGDQSNLHYEVYLGHVMTPLIVSKCMPLLVTNLICIMKYTWVML